MTKLLPYLTNELYDDFRGLLERIKSRKTNGSIMFDYTYWGNGTYHSRLSMALEEYLLKQAANGVASIRFFSFPKARDSIILGYAQDTDVIKKPNGADIARRLTGGSHVQVGSNVLAYTFAVPRNGEFRTYEDMRAYYAEHVANALDDLGIESIDIDNKASTINVDGKVVASHALIWGVKSALLHGLIVLDPYDVDKVNERVYLGCRKIGNKIYTEYSALRNIPAVSNLLKDVAPNLAGEARLRVMKDLLGQAILRRVTKGKHRNRSIDNSVANEAFQIVKEKYGTDFWIKEREPPFTEEEIEEIPGEELKGPLKKGLGYCLFLQVPDKNFKKMAEPQEKE